MVPMAMTRPPERRASLMRCAVGERHPEVLGVGRLVGLEGRHAGVQEQGGHADALGHQPGQDLGGEGPPGARHLGRAGLGGVDVLVGRDRDSCRARSRSGWVARGGPGSCAGARASRRGRPRGARRRRRARGSRASSRATRPPPARLDARRPRWRRGGRGRRGGPPPSRGRPAAGWRGGPGRPAVGAVPSSSAARVPEVLMTTRSPSVEEAGQLGEVRVHQRAVATLWPPACARRRGSCRGTRAGRAPRARAAG